MSVFDSLNPTHRILFPRPNPPHYQYDSFPDNTIWLPKTERTTGAIPCVLLPFRGYCHYHHHPLPCAPAHCHWCNINIIIVLTSWLCSRMVMDVILAPCMRLCIITATTGKLIYSCGMAPLFSMQPISQSIHMLCLWYDMIIGSIQDMVVAKVFHPKPPSTPIWTK